MSDTISVPICAACHQPILGKVVVALGKTWHPENLVCCSCKKPVCGGEFHEKGDEVVCERCHAGCCQCPRCHACHQPITEGLVEAMGVSWHAEHFVCACCGKQLSASGGDGYMEQAGRPYCSSCYADVNASTKGCTQPVEKAIVAQA